MSKPYRSECRCPCHNSKGAMMHIQACCQPDPVTTQTIIPSEERLKEMITEAMNIDLWPAWIWQIVNTVTDNDDQMSTEQAIALALILSRTSSAVPAVGAKAWILTLKGGAEGSMFREYEQAKAVAEGFLGSTLVPLYPLPSTEPSEAMVEAIGRSLSMHKELRITLGQMAHLNDAVRAALSPITEKVAEGWEDRSDAMEQALRQIAQWSDAYPLKVSPEPDFGKVRELLEAGGITLDAVSASNMRHVIDQVGAIAKAALPSSEGKP